MDYTKHESLSELGQIGNGNHGGYIVQNSLAVDAETRNVLGLCNQVLHHRDQVGKKETQAQKRQRESRESLLWLKGVERLPANWSLVDVCDQGADTFEFLEHEVHSGRRFVIHAAEGLGRASLGSRSACGRRTSGVVPCDERTGSDLRRCVPSC